LANYDELDWEKILIRESSGPRKIFGGFVCMCCY